MTYPPTRLITFDDFIAQYSHNPRYELSDGELIDLEPTDPHETVGGKLATQIGIAIAQQNLPWFIPRLSIMVSTCQNPNFVIQHLINEPMLLINTSQPASC